MRSNIQIVLTILMFIVNTDYITFNRRSAVYSQRLYRTV
ncbi:hypothetical protein KSF78_0000336 [Schistosoma japonicum]|nr:hypothetical protein KSF78_0000336 [Schistosoma japonicum]